MFNDTTLESINTKTSRDLSTGEQGPKLNLCKETFLMKLHQPRKSRYN